LTDSARQPCTAVAQALLANGARVRALPAVVNLGMPRRGARRHHRARVPSRV